MEPGEAVEGSAGVIAGLKPYPEYKESGLPWLGQVPEYWSVRRIKTVLRESDCRTVDGSGTLLSLTRVRGLIPHRDMTDKVHSARTLVGYKRYCAGQLVMNRMQAWSGMFGAGPNDGLVSPDYAVFDVLGRHSIKLVLQRLKTPDLVAQFALASKGIGSGFNRLYTDRFGPIPISLPPPDEQAAIVRFVDWANGRLEQVIRAKRKVIALLNEQKQAVIHRAVTRGLDPDVPLKSSGVQWLGAVPQHWTVSRIKRVFREIDRRSGTGKGLLLSLTRKRGLIPQSESSDRPPSAKSFEKYKVCKPGKLVMNRMQAWSGMFAVANREGLISPDYSIFEPIGEQKIQFFQLLFKSTLYIEQFALSSKGIGSGFNRLYSPEFGAISIAHPSQSEQQAILDGIKVETVPQDTAISRLEREIHLLHEYRTRLVADVVTGKLDVREVAARLPDEAAPDTVDNDLGLDPEAADEGAAV